MPTVYSVTGRGYGSGAMTPGNGLVTRESTFVFMSASEAAAYKTRNGELYVTMTDPVATEVSMADFHRLLDTTKPSIRRRLIGEH